MQNVHTEDSKISFIPMFYLLDEVATDVQFEKAARCNIDYDKEGLPRKSTRYVSHIMAQK